MSERVKIVEELLKKDVLVEPGVVDYIIKNGGMRYLPEFLRKYRNVEYVKLSHLKEEKSEDDFKILLDTTNYPVGKGEAEDFNQLFVDRFQRLYKILKRRASMHGSTSISQLGGGDVKVIGMVTDVRRTSSGYTIFDIEDMTGIVQCMYSGDTTILNDEVIGIIGKFSESRKRIYVNEVVRPGILPVTRERKIKEDVSAAIISDIHVGSSKFIKERWKKFIKWIKSNDARNIKYLVIDGDLVDGIGIYPNQLKELEESDIYGQYELLAGYIEEIPDRIKIIMVPGNHDIVGVAEPQPALPEKIRNIFSSDIVFLSNPAYIAIHGYRILLYHGGGLNNFVDMVPGMNYGKTLDMMKLMLEMRHLSPVYGGKIPVVPMSRDFLVIDTPPDVLITGHVHSYAVGKYKGIHLINASTWQSQTEYQKMMNFNPIPGKVAILNFKKDAITTVSF